MVQQLPSESGNARTLKSRYTRLSSRKAEVMRRGRAASLVTIPAILPPEGHNENNELPTPHQGDGARAVNTLSAKMLLALFPPNTAFFKLSPDEELGLSDKEAADVEAGLADVEQRTLKRLEKTKLRAAITTLIKHLLVTGNGTLHVMKDGAVRFFGLNHYVCNRDPAGTVVELILKESVAASSLSAETLLASYTEAEVAEMQENPDKNVDIYTSMKLEDNRYRVYQELNGFRVAGSDGAYRKGAPPFIVQRWTEIPDEDYGRGMVDEYLGDFQALDKLSRDLLKASAAAAKIVWTVSPNSTIRPKDLEVAESGAVLQGDNADVGTVGLDKFADFRITLERLRNLEEKLSKAFLMHTSVQREAERVTAEEIRFLAQELEDALGGVYSVLAQELQAPLVRRYLDIMQKGGELPSFSEEDVSIQVTTGLEALGRGHSLNKLLSLVNQAKDVLGPDVVARRLNQDVFFKQLETGYGLAIPDLFLSEEEVQQNGLQEQVRTALEASAPNVLKNLTQPSPTPQPQE